MDKQLWADFICPPINLWNFPKQYKDISDDDIRKWVEEYNTYFYEEDINDNRS